MKNLRETLVVTTGLVMGTAIGVLTTALGLALVGSPWELHFSTHHVATVAVALTGITVVAQGVVIVVDLLVGASFRRSPPSGRGVTGIAVQGDLSHGLTASPVGSWELRGERVRSPRSPGLPVGRAARGRT